MDSFVNFLRPLLSFLVSALTMPRPAWGNYGRNRKMSTLVFEISTCAYWRCASKTPIGGCSRVEGAERVASGKPWPPKKIFNPLNNAHKPAGHPDREITTPRRFRWAVFVILVVVLPALIWVLIGA